MHSIDILKLEQIFDRVTNHYMLYTDASILKKEKVKDLELELYDEYLLKHKGAKAISLVEFLYYTRKRFAELKREGRAPDSNHLNEL